MPRDSNGNASTDPVYVATPGTAIRAVQHNTPIADIIQMLTGSLARNGTGGMLANLAMGGFKITGLADGENPQDAVTFGQSQDKYLNYVTPQTLTAEQKKSVVSAIGAIPQYATGAALPDANIGPIWHDDYSDILTWRTIGSYTGYASVSVGNVGYHANSTPPTGTLERNGAAVSRTTYAALFAKIGTTYGAGDGSTTFNLPDDRGLFDRSWDHGRGVDSGRSLGSYQSYAVPLETGAASIITPTTSDTTNGPLYVHNIGSTFAAGGSNGRYATLTYNNSLAVNTASESRPSNRAYLSVIHF